MDVRCPLCAELVDVDEIQDLAAKMREDFAVAWQAFRRNGCNALGYMCEPGKATSVISDIYDLCEDDIDAASVALADADMEELLEDPFEDSKGDDSESSPLFD